MAVKRGDEVRVRFWDHMENTDHPSEYLLYGRVQRCGPRAISVDCWAHVDLDNPERDPSGSETKTYTILRKCITEVAVAEWRPVSKRKPNAKT